LKCRDFWARPGEHFVGFVGTILGTVWLLSLYTFAVWAVVGSLTSIQIRDEFNARAISAGGEGISFADASRRQLDLVRAEKAIRSEVENHPIARKDRERLETLQMLGPLSEYYYQDYVSTVEELNAITYRGDRYLFCYACDSGDVLFTDETTELSTSSFKSDSCAAFDHLLALD
jgi:hypothetical protein